MGTRLGQQRFVNGIRVFRRNWTQREFYEERVSIVPITGCWMWMSWIDKCGYGKMAGPGHSQLAHRCSYEHFVGPIPAGMELDHKCRNRWCINPSHLEPVSGYENQRRGDGIGGRNLRKTHCPSGHPYSGDNLIQRVQRNGRINRQCRSCQTMRRRGLWREPPKDGGA